MPTVRELAERVKGIRDELIVLQTKIGDSYTAYRSGSTRSTNTRMSSEIRDLKEDADKYDTEFREHERYLQQSGGKPRHQTLQEFVFLFFWTGFTLLSISLAIFSYVSSGSWFNSLKIIGLMLFIALMTTAIIIRYA